MYDGRMSDREHAAAASIAGAAERYANSDDLTWDRAQPDL